MVSHNLQTAYITICTLLFPLFLNHISEFKRMSNYWYIMFICNKNVVIKLNKHDAILKQYALKCDK